MPTVNAKSLDAARSKFLLNCGLCVGAVVVVMLFPGKAKTAGNAFRLYCTLTFFGALVAMCLQMLAPRSRLMEMQFVERFRNCPPSLDRASKRYLNALDRLVNGFVYVCLAVISLVALRVLSSRVLGAGPWIGFLGPYHDTFRFLYYVAVLALLLFPFYMNSAISEVIQMKRQLDDQDRNLGWSSFKEGESRQQSGAPADGKTVLVKKDGGFRAGQVDWEWSDLVKNCVVFGQSGSGKTVCVLNAMIEGLLGASARSQNPASALILDPKGDFAEKVSTLCRKYGRRQDLLIVDPTNMQKSIRWNPFDSEDDELELATRFAAVLESQGMRNEQDSFWIDSAKKFLRHALTLLRLSNHPGRPPDFAQINELVTNKESIADRARRVALTDDRCEQCLNFFANEWLQYEAGTRTSIQGNITNMIDAFLMPPYGELFSGQSTLRVSEMVNQGRILYVNMPVADKEAMSRMVCSFLKLEYFREVLKGRNKARPSFFLCDEFQVFFTTGQGKSDADFFERSRQSNHANLIAVQNLPSLRKVTSREDLVENLLGHCAVKIFLRNTDQRTNKWASELFGKMIVDMGGVQSGGAGGKRGVPGLGGLSSSTSDQYDDVVKPERFPELAIPSQSAGVDYAEAIIHLASRETTDKLQRNYRWKVHPL